jgi:hypothetical protein
MDIATGLKENGYVTKKNQMKKEDRMKKLLAYYPHKRPTMT